MARHVFHAGRGARAGLGALWVLVASSLPSPLISRAFAQQGDAAASEALFREGRRLMKAGDYESACPKLEESLRLDPALGTLFNLASCEEQLGRWATAWQHWRQAADQLPSEDKRRATAVARATALEKMLPRLTISLAAGAPPETEIQRNGVRFGTASLGLAIPVNPGRHVVTASAPGRETREFVVTMAAKEVRNLVVEPGGPRSGPPAVAAVAAEAVPNARMATPEPATVAPDSSGVGTGALATDAAAGRDTWGYVLLAGGAAALGAGGFFATKALAARDDAKAACPAGQGVCRVEGKDALDRDKRFSLLTDVGLGAGLLLAGAGLYLLFTDGEAASGQGGETTRASLSPLPGGGAFSLQGRF